MNDATTDATPSNRGYRVFFQKGTTDYWIVYCQQGDRVIRYSDMPSGVNGLNFAGACGHSGGDMSSVWAYFASRYHGGTPVEVQGGLMGVPKHIRTKLRVTLATEKRDQERRYASRVLNPHRLTYNRKVRDSFWNGKNARFKLAKRVAAVMRLLRDDAQRTTAYDTDLETALDEVFHGGSIPSHLLETLQADINRAIGASKWSARDHIQLLECGHFNVGDHYDTTHLHNGTEVCDWCVEDGRYVPVEETGEYYARGDVYLWESDDEYHLTEEYDEEYDEDEDEDEDHLSSWSGSTANMAHDTSFTPSSGGDFTMGVELEVEVNDGYNRSEAVRDCDHHFNQHRTYAMFKHDGSLDEDRGFEIVTAARRMGDHIKMFKDWTPHNDLTSWDAGNCGLHVHIDSRAFTALTLGKFLMFYNQGDNMRLIKSVAGRHPTTDSQAGKYARLNNATGDPHVVKSRYENDSRYKMVNVVNLTCEEQKRLKIEVSRDCKGDYSTVEVRIFRGTLRKARLLAQIEFAHASVAFCRVASWSALGEGEFRGWLETQGGYPHLTQWLGTQRARNKRYERAAETMAESNEV